MVQQQHEQVGRTISHTTTTSSRLISPPPPMISPTSIALTLNEMLLCAVAAEVPPLSLPLIPPSPPPLSPCWVSDVGWWGGGGGGLKSRTSCSSIRTLSAVRRGALCSPLVSMRTMYKTTTKSLQPVRPLNAIQRGNELM